MDAFERIRNVFQRPTNERTFAMIAPERAGNRGGTPIEPKKAYVQFRLRRMRLRYAGFLHKEFYPVVHSFVEVSRKGANRVTVPYVAGPGQLSELDKGEEQVILTQNVDLIGPTPYIGGTVNLAVGLCAAQAKDYLSNLVGVMGSLSDVLGTNPLTSVLAIVEPLKGAAESFLGLDGQVQLKIGTTNGFAEPRGDARDNAGDNTNSDESVLVDGLYALVAVPEKDGWGPWFQWAGGELRVQFNNGKVTPVEHDYLVFEITQSPEMPDWSRLPDLNKKAETVQTVAAKDGLDADSYREAFAALKVAVIESADLIDSDRVRIIRGTEKQAKDLSDRLGEPPDGLGLRGEKATALGRAVDAGPSIEMARTLKPESL